MHRKTSTRKICFCASGLAWIVKHLKPSAVTQFHVMVSRVSGRARARIKHRRSAAQKRATAKLVRFNKRHKKRRRR